MSEAKTKTNKLTDLHWSSQLRNTIALQSNNCHCIAARYNMLLWEKSPDSGMGVPGHWQENSFEWKGSC